MWFNVKIHRLLGRIQSIYMTFRESRAVIVTLITALATIVYNVLKLRFNENGTDDLFGSLAYTGLIIASVYTILDIIISYRKWKKGMRIISDSAEKRELQTKWKLGKTEKNDGFEIKSFFNGKSYEYFIESDAFNRQLRAGEQINYLDMKYKYKLPEELKKLIPKIMENAFRRPEIIYNGRLLRQASHIELNGKNVLVQKVCYFDGQCSHEIVYKQFFSPEQIDVFFNGKRLLVSNEDVLYDLNHSSCANFIGVSMLMITKDKYLVIGKQGTFSNANRGRYAPSGSGSVEYADIRKACKYYKKSANELTFNDILTFAMEREFCEECNYELKKLRPDVKTMLLGFVRLLERGGKPDYFGISYLNAKIVNSESDNNFDIRRLEYGLTDKIEPIRFEKWEEIPDKLKSFVEKHQENCEISIQLYLLMRYVEDMKKQGLLKEKLKELGCDIE